MYSLYWLVQKTQITPLCVACLTKEVASVKRLLEKGAHPNGAEEVQMLYKFSVTWLLGQLNPDKSVYQAC